MGMEIMSVFDVVAVTSKEVSGIGYSVAEIARFEFVLQGTNHFGRADNLGGELVGR
jgi:hypothetical protein